MDHANEAWIKVYTRDTASWLSTSLAARGLALEISRKMGRFSDEISLGPKGLRAVAALVSAPWAEVEPLLRELLDDGRLVYDESRQVIHDRQHIARQTAQTSPAQRQRDSREGKSRKPAPTEDESDAPVTLGHAVSRAVTPCHEEKEKKEEKEGERASARVTPPVLRLTAARTITPRPDEPLTPDRHAVALERAAEGGVTIDVPAVWRGYLEHRIASGVAVASVDYDWRGWVTREVAFVRQRQAKAASGGAAPARASPRQNAQLRAELRAQEAKALTTGASALAAQDVLRALGG